MLRSIAGIAAFDFAASPLDRSVETMRLLRAELGLDPEGFRLDPGLIEITFGSWEGFTLAELAVERADDVRRRQTDKWGFVPPGGESYAMLTERVSRWLGTLDRDTVAVSHGAVGRVVQGLLTGAAEQEIPSLPSPQDKVLLVGQDGSRWL